MATTTITIKRPLGTKEIPMTARDLLDMIESNVTDLRNKASAGGETEYQFDLRIDISQLSFVLSILQDQNNSTDGFNG